MLESSSSALVKVLHLVRTAPCNAALVPLLYQGCRNIRLFGVGDLWPWMHFLGFRSSLPQHHRVLFCSLLCLHALFHEAHGIPELVHAEFFEACLRQRTRSDSAGLSSPKNIFQSILSLQLGLLQRSLIRRCTVSSPWDHILQCSLGFELCLFQECFIRDCSRTIT